MRLAFVRVYRMQRSLWWIEWLERLDRTLTSARQDLADHGLAAIDVALRDSRREAAVLVTPNRRRA